MLLMKWLLFVFLLLETEKYFSFAKTYIISKPSEVYSLAENLTFPNRIINSNNKNNNETRAREFQISDMIRTSQQTNNGFSTDLQPLKCNNTSNIKIHCCKKSNSLIECKYDAYKYKIKLNNNMLTQDQIGGLVRSIYTFVDSLTSNNYDLTTAAPILSTITAYPIPNNTDRLYLLKTYFNDELNKLNSRGINSQITDEILQSNDKYKVIKFKNFKECDPNQQNKIIECSLNNKINLNKGANIRALRNSNEEPELKLSCKLIGSRSTEPKIFTIPLSLTDSESRSDENNDNKIYEDLLVKGTKLTEEQYDILDCHQLKKRNCRTDNKHNTKTVKKKEHNYGNYSYQNNNEVVRTHINDENNHRAENEFNKIMWPNKISNLNQIKSKQKETNGLQEEINEAPEKADTLRHKLNSVKEWVLNLKEKKIKSKGELQKDEAENEKQSHFLFNPKTNDSSTQGNIFQTDKPKKFNGKKNKDKIVDKGKLNGNKISNANTDTYDSTHVLEYLYDDVKTSTKSMKKHNKTKVKDEDNEKSQKEPNTSNTKNITQDTDKQKSNKQNDDTEKTTEAKVTANETVNPSDSSTAKSNTKHNKTNKSDKEHKHSEISFPTTSIDETEDSDGSTIENTEKHFENNEFTQSLSITTESYLYKKLKNMKDKKNNFVKSFTRQSDETKNEEVTDNEKYEKTSKSHESLYTTGNIFKEFFVFNKHNSQTQNETNESVASTQINKETKVLEAEKMVNDEDHTYPMEHLKLLEDENETDNDEEQAENESDKNEYEDYSSDSIKQNVNPFDFNNNGLLLNTLNINQHKKRLEAFREDENRRKRLFDFISLLKQTKHNSIKN